MRPCKLGLVAALLGLVMTGSGCGESPPGSGSGGSGSAAGTTGAGGRGASGGASQADGGVAANGGARADGGAQDSGDGGQDAGAGGAETGGASPKVLYAPFVSGTRLRVNRIAGDDGSLTPIGLYDLDIGAPCTFAPAEDGIRRCLPLSVENAQLSYSDSACSQPYASVQACEGPGDWLYGSVGDTSRSRAFKLGAEIPYQERSWFWDWSTNPPLCVQGPGPAVERHFRSAQAFPPETFVRGTTETSSAAPPARLAATYMVGADGSKALVSYQDASLGLPCTFRSGADGHQYCAPDNALATLGFSDDQCVGDTIALVPAGQTRPPWVIVGAELGFRAHRLGARYQGPSYESIRLPVGGLVCRLVPAGDFDAYRLEAEDVTAEVLVAGTPAPLDAPGRLKRPAFAAEDGSIIEQPADWGLLDTRFNEVCKYEQSVDGLRCLPPLLLTLPSGWLDDTCTTTPVFDSSLLSVFFSEAKQVHWSLGTFACNFAITEVRSVDHPTKVYEPQSPLACVPYATVSPNWFTVGAAVPFTEFVAGTISHE